MVKQLIADRGASIGDGDLSAGKADREKIARFAEKKKERENLVKIKLTNGKAAAATGMSLISPRGFAREEPQTPEQKRKAQAEVMERRK